jgi:hypothetical protein
MTTAVAILLMVQHWILFVPVHHILKKKLKKTQRRTFSGRQGKAETTVQTPRKLGKAA